MNAQLHRLLEGRYLEPDTGTDAEIVDRWQSILEVNADARRCIGSEARVMLCYETALKVALAIVRCAGYRVRGSEGGHHYVAFTAAHALAPGRAADLALQINGMRWRRHETVYGSHRAQELDAEEMCRLAQELVPAAYEWLTQARPEIAPELQRP
jgi:hypothetical protein